MEDRHFNPNTSNQHNRPESFLANVELLDSSEFIVDSDYNNGLAAYLPPPQQFIN